MADKPVGNMKFGLGIEGIDKTLNTLDKLNRAIKVSESSMKANISAYDKAGNSIQALAQKQDDLAGITALQAEKIKVLTKRRKEYIETYGAESKQVASVTDQLNKASSKYNAYSSQLDKTKQSYIIAANGADKYTKAIKDNETQMKSEVKALRDSGDKVGAYKAQKKGLENQEKLTAKAIKAQEGVVAGLTKEFGANSKEVNDAKAKLEAYKRQQQLTSKQIDGTNKSITQTEASFNKLNDELEETSSKSNKTSKALAAISGATATVTRGVGRITSGVGSALGGVAKLAGHVGFGALLTAGNKAFNAVTSNIDSAISRIDTLNNSTRAFSNMGFEDSKITTAMDNISKAIQGLPTPLQDAVSNVQLLAASTGNLELSVDVYKALNDAILGFGGDANMAQNAIVQLSQAFSNGKIDAQTWNSMINSGLGPTLNALAKEMGKTTGELKTGLSEGTISVTDFQSALIKLDKEGGGGLKSLDTIAKDSTKGISTSIANAKTAMVRGTAELIKSVDEALKNLNLPTIGEFITNAGTNVEGFMKKVAGTLPEVAKNFSFVGDVFNGVQTFIGNAVASATDFSGKVIGAVSKMADFIKNVWNGTNTNNDYYLLSMTGLSYDTIFKIEDITKNVKEKLETFKGYIIGFTKLFSSNDATSLDGYSMLRKLGMSPEAIGKIEEFGNKIGTVFQSIKENYSKYIGTVLDIGGRTLSTIFDFIINKVIPILAPAVTSMLNTIGTGFKDVFGFISNWWDKNGDRIMKAFQNLLIILTPIIAIAIEVIKSFVNSVVGLIKGMVKVITGVIDVFSMVLTGDFTGLWESIKNIFFGAIQAVWNYINILFIGRIFKAVGGFVGGIKTFFSGMWESTKTIFTSGGTSVLNGINSFIGGAWNFFKTLGSNLKNTVSSMWSGIKGIFSGGIDTVLGWVKSMPGKMADGIKKGASVVGDAFKGLFNGALRAIGKPVNGIISGANWVLEKLGADKLAEWDVPKYATGTPDGGHPGGLMMVNDGRGAEAVISPNGQAFIPKGRNVVMNAPKGTHVLTAEETAYMTGNKAPKYRYKKGTNFFGNLWDNVKGFAGNVGNKLKDTVGDVWEFMSNPAELAKKVLGGLGVLDGLVKYPLQVGKGILSKATTALTDKIKGLFSSGNLDTSIGTNGVYKYLADVTRDVMAKFPGFVATSGYRPGDPYSHGKRNAIDIALPGVTGGSSRYTEAANYAFEKFASKVGYVITNGKVRDRSGQSGQGSSGQWVPWPDGDHYDHVHINGIKNPQDKQISGENINGSGVERWRGVAAQALRMTGQYSTANLNALLNQMRTESNGNPNAINNWDINALNGTPSKGLLQVIDPTFRAYAMPGHNSNIFDPLSNILASIRYALSRYGSLTNAYRGVGYENGGLIKKQHLAMVGEGNKEEVVIPLTGTGMKRTRAMQLLAYANEKLNKKKDVPTANTANGNDTLMTMIALLQEQNGLLQELLAKDTNLYMDGTKVNSKLNTIQETKERNQRRNLGLV